MEGQAPWQGSSLAQALSAVPDPRVKRRRVHELVPVLLMCVAAMLCGARTTYAMAQWGRERREDDPQRLADLGLKPGRTPSVPTLHRLFKRLDVAAFEKALGTWLEQLGVQKHERLAVDGKTLRGIHGEQVPGVHLVSVYALESHSVLTQVAAPGKGQEQAAVATALGQVDLEGRVVMGDALQTQRDLCAQVVAGGGDYLLPVKENQPTLLSDLKEAFSPSEPGGKRL